jgi:hypothetical protein
MFSPFIAISPDSNHIAVARKPTLGDISLDIYDAATGEHLARTEPQHRAKFAPDGREVWGYFLPLSEDILPWETYNRELGFTSLGWAIVRDSESGLPRLENVIRNVEGPPIFPWESLCDYGIGYQRWVLSPSEKLLLWLPPLWRPRGRNIVWRGQFLALLHPELPQFVVLELPEE